MTVIFFLIGVGILVAGGFLAAFIWAVKSGQYDDDYTPSVRILFDNYISTSNNSTTGDKIHRESAEEEKYKTDKSDNNKN